MRKLRERLIAREKKKDKCEREREEKKKREIKR